MIRALRLREAVEGMRMAAEEIRGGSMSRLGARATRLGRSEGA